MTTTKTGIVRRPARWHVDRLDGRGRATLIDQDPADGTETYHAWDGLRCSCVQCGQHRYHDVYVEVVPSREAYASRPLVRVITVCRDCQRQKELKGAKAHVRRVE
jgi:hypothetical protein